MALTIEDGTIVTGADSYISETDYQAWADARFGASRSTAPADDAAAESLILRAMDYFEGSNFKGVKTTEDQPLQWPRAYVAIDSYEVGTGEIPNQVKLALYELTYMEETSEGLSNTIERAVTKEKIGPIEVEYDENASSRTMTPSVTRAMSKLLQAGGGLRVVRI